MSDTSASSFVPDPDRAYSPEELGIGKPTPSLASSDKSWAPDPNKAYSPEELGLSTPQATPQKTPVDDQFEQRVQKYMPEAQKVLAPRSSLDYIPGIKQGFAAAEAGVGLGEGDTFSERYKNMMAKQEAYSRAKTQDEEARIQKQMPAVQDVYNQESPLRRTAESAAHGFANIPVLGPIAAKGASALTAAMQGPEEGATYDERYLNNQAKLAATQRMYAENNPVANIAGSLAQAPLLPGGSAETVGQLATTGAGLGVAEAVGQGDNPLTGGAIGGAGGVAGAALGAVGQKAADALSRTGSIAKGLVAPASQGETSGVQKFGQKYLDDLARAPKDANGNVTDQRFLTPGSMGEDSMGADIGGGALAREARAQAVQHPEFESQIRSDLDSRHADQKQNMQQMFQNLYGENMDPVQLMSNAKDTARQVNAPNYAEVFNDPRAQSVWNDKLNLLTKFSDFPSMVGDAKRKLELDAIATGKEPPKAPLFATSGEPGAAPQTDFSLQFWDAIKRSAQEKAVQTGDNNYFKLANVVKDALGPQYLGDLGQKYHDTLSTAAKYFGQQDAFSGGQQLARSINSMKRGQIMQNMKQYTPEELSHMEKGFTSELMYNVMNSTNPNSVTKMLDSPNIKSTFKELVPSDRGDQIEGFLRLQNIQNKSRQAILNQSKTMQNAVDYGRKVMHSPYGVAAIGGGAYEGLNYLEGVTDPGSFAHKAMLAGTAALVASRYNKFNAAESSAIQRMLLEKDPAAIQQAISSVANQPKGMQILRNLDRTTSRSIAPVTTFMKNFTAPTYDDQNDQNRPMRKSGGRSTKKVPPQPGEIDFFKRVLSVMREHKKSTKHALHKHDNEVASSLEHAQQQVTNVDPVHN